jgi:hypothetical protein
MKKSELEKKLYVMFPDIYGLGYLEIENGADFKYCGYFTGCPYSNPIFGRGHVDHLVNIVTVPNETPYGTKFEQA